MRSTSAPVYILGSSRIPFAKSGTTYAETTRKDLMVASLDGLVSRFSLQNRTIGDIALGALMNSASDWNLARECVLSTDLHPASPAYNVQRACGTSLETTWHIALKVHAGQIDLGIAGGVDTNSDMPMELSDPMRKLVRQFKQSSSGRATPPDPSAPSKPGLAEQLSQVPLSALLPKSPDVVEPRTHLSMGQHCELMVKEWQIPREAQDELALASHLNGAKAYDAGFFDNLITPFAGLSRDGTLRGDTSLEKLAKLKPAFDPEHGTLTAGNSSPLTDGSSTVLIGTTTSADQLGLTPLAKVIDFQTAAVDFVGGEGLLMAPTKAVAQLLTRNQLTFQDFDFFEIHEAFAAQVLCNLKAWESDEYCKTTLGLPAALGPIDRTKLNVVGSSLAVGHPFAATGTRIVGTLAKLLSTGGTKRGLISICTAGGMGVAAILESA